MYCKLALCGSGREAIRKIHTKSWLQRILLNVAGVWRGTKAGVMPWENESASEYELGLISLTLYRISNGTSLLEKQEKEHARGAYFWR